MPRSRRSWHICGPSTRRREANRKDERKGDVLVPRMSGVVTMVLAGAHSRGAQPAQVVLALWLVAVIGVFVPHGTGLAAEQASAPGDQVHTHAGDQPHGAFVGSDVPRDASSNEPVYYLTLNVEISDTGIQPSAVFIPAGRPVQLLLRSRGSTEHHYRVVGLVPDELSWIAEPESGMGKGVSNDDHHHHGRTFVRWRATSPAGIGPTGDEVHAYVSTRGSVDVVLFTATQVGTFVVQCDLHSEKLGKLVVFEGAKRPAAVVAAPGNALSPARGGAMGLAPGNALSLALSRDLGTVEYPGPSEVFVEATYAPAQYVTQILGEPAAMTVLEPDRYVAILLTEGVHAGSLPSMAEPPDLYVSGSHLPLIDWTVTTDLPHHRATFYRFARDDTFGATDQVMTLRLASGQEATWDLPGPNTWFWLAFVSVTGGLGFVGWLIWTVVSGRVRRSNEMDVETT